MIQTQERTERGTGTGIRNPAPTTARCASLSESPTRCWAYSQASGDVDEVAVGTGLNFGQPAGGAADRRRSQRADAGDRFYTCASSA
jgi:hypothetical protein